jgi:hypothetical protein
MKKRTVITAILMVTLTALNAAAMQDHDSHGSGDTHATQADQKTDHSGHGGGMGAADGTFTHHASVDGLEAEFQVMSLASMNMTSDTGETHHIMVSFKDADSGEPVKDAIGKVKVIGPDGKEQISPLKNYSGILAANFSFPAPGKYGVICLVKQADEKRVFKFWYHHM